MKQKAVFLLKYLFSSVSCSVMDLLLFQLFVRLGMRWFGPEAELICVPLATVLARAISATYNYLVNYFFVFKSNEGKGTSAAKFLVLTVLQMLASAGLTTLGCWLFPGLPDLTAGGQVILASGTIIKAVVDIGLFFAAYFVQKKLIF